MPAFVIDEHIPFIRGILEPFGRVTYLPGQKIRRKDLLHADGLIVRTRTICSRELLEGTSVRFIVTATIGFDHIDTGYCDAKGVAWFHSPGCNASGVEQYIASALARLAGTSRTRLAGKTIGIVGVGHVGSRIERVARILDMKPLLNDPPRERKEGPGRFVSLDRIAEEADIVTLHVPLNTEGEDRTVHLADHAFFSRLKKKPVFINTSRGPVTDSEALKCAIQEELVSTAVVDVWENEPGIDLELMKLADIATPHVAGYSLEGKALGTAMCVRAASRHFGLGLDEWYPAELPGPENPVFNIEEQGLSFEAILLEATRHAYDIMKDDGMLRRDPGRFEEIRNHYPVRREFAAFCIVAGNLPGSFISKLKGLGFTIK
jgi:erythronate-4-phosphate dehydrogenase